MAMGETGSWTSQNDTTDEEKREKVLVPVRCRKETLSEELSDAVDEEKVWETPRRWRVY